MYSVHNENFSHLFFHCNFSFQVLFYVMRFCGWRGFQREWSVIIAFVMSPHHSKIRRLILSLGLSGTVYYIWRERNSQLHGDPTKSAMCLGRKIVQIIKCKLHSSNLFRKSATRLCYRHMLLDDLV